MREKLNLPYLPLFLMISFASVNAVLFTPALPDIATYFAISEGRAQDTITWFLIGYALGQLIYGPIANRFGRKPALYAGIALQIISSFICVLAGIVDQYLLLILGRFLLALGSGVGLTLTFTMINDYYDTKVVSKKTSHLMLAFAITPALSVALGSVLNEYFGWMTCFYACALYGIVVFTQTLRLPETQTISDANALNVSALTKTYIEQFKNQYLIAGGLLMGTSTAVIYVFSASAPFIGINFFGLTSVEYGAANLLPLIGLVCGLLYAPNLLHRYSLRTIIGAGIVIVSVSSILMLMTFLFSLPALLSLFIPMIFLYFGLCFVISNASSLAMSRVADKAHGSAVMSFINMGTATVVVLSVGLFQLAPAWLPSVFILLCLGMIGIYCWVKD